MGRKLFVGNLPYDTDESQLEELFTPVGQVDTVRIMRDQATGRSRGFAFVEMMTDEEAAKAVEDLSEAQLGGRTLTINEARPKPSFGGGGGGGGWGGGGGGGGGKGRGRGRGREPRW